MIGALQFLSDLSSDAASDVDFGAEDRAYLAEIQHAQRHKESLAARVALSDALAQQYGSDIGWTIYRKGRGKTFVRPNDGADVQADAAAGNLTAPHVSLAHSNEAAIAVVTSNPCGVDLECVGRERLERPWARLTNAEERAWCAHLPARERPAYILASWTLKEAWAKVRGDGLAPRAREIAIDPREDGTWRVLAPRPLSIFYALYRDHAITIVVDGDCERIKTKEDIAWTRWPVKVVQADTQTR